MVDRLAPAIDILARKGLNIFASLKTKNLSSEILSDFAAAGISLTGRETLCILAHGGRTLWNNLEHPLDEARHPIDSFSLAQVHWLNDTVLRDPSLNVLFPGEHLIPLQKIGRFLNISRPSLLGLDMNQEFGVWFAFRAAFLTTSEIPEIRPPDFISACASCSEKPCQKVCPPSAVQNSAEEFQLRACATHRLSPNSECLSQCLARNSCPYKHEHQYSVEQMAYHNLRATHLRYLVLFRDALHK